jgi:hypothetical protein
MAVSRAEKVAELQANLLLAEQSLEYGAISLEEISKELKYVDNKLADVIAESKIKEDRDKYALAKAVHENATVNLIEERMLMVVEIDKSKSRVASYKAQLKKLGAGPKERPSMEEMTLGARMAALSLIKPSESFAAQSAFRHHDNGKRFDEAAQEALEAQRLGDFTHAKSAAHFNYAATSMLINLVRFARAT